MEQDTATRTPVLSADPHKALQDMMQTIDTMRSVYEEETQALRVADLKAFFALQNKKIAAATDYHAGIAELISRKEEILDVHPDLKNIFNRKHSEFSAVAADNLDALTRMRRTVDRLSHRVMQAARDAAVRDSVNYSARGSMNNPRNRPITMGLNESA
ncbi:MAG: flagellar protein FlgN [Micavibrio aeruginosavorus]|nr:flagellar protein FlgN [Micavibrio aeruginosavorus]